MTRGRPEVPRPRAHIETSAGGVVVRMSPDATGPARPLFLIIRDSYDNWGFPKGHVEEGEPPEAAALREVTAQMIKQKTSGSISTKTFDQWQALLWILAKSGSGQDLAQTSTNAAASTNSLRQLHELADKLALRASAITVQSNFVMDTLLSLARTSGDFIAEKNYTELCFRAERLVLALDRLLLSSSPEQRSRLDSHLNQLFRAVQNRQAIDPAGFAAQLRSFESALTAAR